MLFGQVYKKLFKNYLFITNITIYIDIKIYKNITQKLL